MPTTIANNIYTKALQSGPKKLAIIQVGNNESSNLYISIKKKRLEEIGFRYDHAKLEEDISYNSFETQIQLSASDASVDGIIVQLPIPQYLLPALEKIPYYKDADGITLRNQAMLFRGAPEETYIAPATAIACLAFLDFHEVQLKGSQVALFGKSFLVGKPILSLLQQRGSTVVALSRFDPKQAALSSQCEVLISAMGCPHYITPEYVKHGAFVIDIGITKVLDQVFGDVHPEVAEKAAFVSKTKGHIGPLTVAFLISNLMKCANLKEIDGR